MTEPPLPPRVRAHVLVPFILVTLIWGSTWLVIRDQLGVVPAGWSVTYRFLIASAGMFTYALATGASLAVPRSSWGVLLLVGIPQFVLNFNLVYRAEAYITSGLVAVIFALLLVPNAILARIFLGQGLSRPFLIGSLVAMFGIGLLFAHEVKLDGADNRAVFAGIGLTLVAVLCASIANVVQALERARSIPIPTLLAWSMAIGALINGGLAWIMAGPPTFDTRIGYIAGLIYLGLAASAFAFLLYYRIIREIGAARAAYSSVLVPIIAMALSTVFEGYRWSVTAALGGALTLAGLVLALRARSPSR
ncbi:DMT family transporter [Sphingomonas sp.]|uniref:DMT family transporter n=1 Tax=Sphingomonas sp. TaxID=28214 RepID=UPI002DE408F1|nr:DMT family transporter [Sphingomonas sp.]